MPKVSVLIPSYNHEAFVQEAIRSVLDQSFQDLEIVVVDDGSTDGTVQRVREIRDPRIRLTVFPRNRGACVAANRCIEESKGEYLAMLSSDDSFLPGKLEKQVAFLDGNPGVAAVFGLARFVGADGKELSGSPGLKKVFDQENRSRHEWLRRFFHKGNCLCHPTVLIRRGAYPGFDPRMANLPDLDVWVRVCLKHEIHVLQEPLIAFRILDEKGNASGNRPSTHIRARFECRHILDHYIEIPTADELEKVFPDIRRFGEPRDRLVPYFLGRYGAGMEQDFIRLWGLDLLFRLLGDREMAERIEAECGFSFPDFLRMTGEADVFHLYAGGRPRKRGLKRLLSEAKKVFRGKPRPGATSR